MTTELFKYVDKSTKECEAINAANKSLIECGLEIPCKPSAAIVRKEEEEKKRQALAIGEENRFNECCEKFWQEVKKLLPESTQKQAEIKGKFFRFSNHAEGAEVRIYESYHTSWSRTPSGRTLRVESSGYGRKKIFKSKTQDIALLHTEAETVKKVADLLTESHRIKVSQDDFSSAKARRSANGEKAYRENKAEFDALGISQCGLTGEDGIFKAQLTIEATVEQWKAIAAIIKGNK